MKIDWKSALGFVLSGALLWYVFRSVSIADVWADLQSANWALLALGTVVATCIFPLRARRWRTILEPTAGAIGFGPLWRGTAIGMMMNNVLPMRAGEFARAFSLTREVPAVRITTSLSSLAVDRIFDAIVLLALMFLAMLDGAFPLGVEFAGQTMTQLAVAGIGLVGGVLLVCYFAVLQRTRVLDIVSRLAHRVVPKHATHVVEFVDHGIGGLAVLRDSRRFFAVLWWATAHWLVHALGLYIAMMAFGVDVPFSAALFLQGIIGIGVAAPSSPGFFGVFEAISVIGLGVYGVTEQLALSWALTYHILSFIPITVMGAVYFMRLGVSLAAVAGAKSDVQS
jgi:uncharacterized protein (TIRG00374 family)